MPSRDRSVSSSSVLEPFAPGTGGGRITLPTLNVSEIIDDGNVSWMKCSVEGWQITNKSTADSVSSPEAPTFLRSKVNCRPRTVEITRFVCAKSKAVVLANTSNGSLGEYS